MNAFSQRTNNLTNKDNKLKLKLKTLNNIQIGINNNEKLNNIKQIVENIRKHNINFAKDTRHTLSTIAILNEVNLPSTTTTTQPHNTTPSNPSSIPSHKRTHSKGRSLTTLKTLKDENSEMRKQIAALQRENTYLKEENHNLKLKLTAYTTTTTIESSRTNNNNGMYCYNYSVPNLFMSNSNSNHNGNRSYSNKQGCSLNSSVCNSNSNVGATSLSKVPLACSRMEKKKRQLLMFNINNNFITTQQPSLTVANVNANSNSNNHLVYHNYNQHTYNVGDKQRVLSANKKTIHTNNSLNDYSWCYSNNTNDNNINCGKFNVKMLNQIKMRMFKLLNFYESVYNSNSSSNSNNRMLYSNYISDNPLSRNKNISRTNSENSRQSSNYIYNSNYSNNNYNQMNSDINNLKYRLNNTKTVYVVKNNNLTIA
jgi:regulator of replication initiation timing